MGTSAQGQRVIIDNRFGDGAFITLGDTHYHSAPHKPETTPQPFASIPFSRDRDFVSRGDITEQINQRCLLPAGRMALVGLGGVGKSQLAIEYAYRFADVQNNAWVFWVHASTQARVEEGFRTIADAVKLAGRNESGADIAFLVQNWLADERNGRWLMVLDSADDLEVFFSKREAFHSRPFATYLPQSQNGSIIITTRDKGLAVRLTGEVEDIIEIPPMTPTEALTLLEKKLKVPCEEHLSRELVKALDFVPLAISQATAYIKKNQGRSSIGKYLADFRKSNREKIRLLEHEGGDIRRDGAASNAILTTWQISFNYIRIKRPSAADLLSLMSCFDSQGIPELVLKVSKRSPRRVPKTGIDGYEHLPSEESDSVFDSDIDDGDGSFENDIMMLRDYCLIGITKGGNEFEMHELIQLSTKRWLQSSGRQDEFEQKFIEILAGSFPNGEYETWAVCRGLLPHTQLALDYKPADEQLDNWATLLDSGARYTFLQGQYDIAERMINKAKKWRITKLGEDHPDTLASMGNLALTYSKSGRWKEAENLEVQVMQMSKRKLGEDHPDTLASMGNLASTFCNQGRWEEAEKLEVQVMERRKIKFGEDHPDTLTSMGNLASTYRSQGRWEEAEKLEVQVMQMSKRKLGEDHPDTLTSMGNLASTYRSQGRWEESEKLEVQIMQTSKGRLVEDHPDTLTSMGNLASTYKSQGRWKEAEKLEVQAMQIRKRKLGEDHPYTLKSMGNLASTYRSQGRWEEAEKLELQVIEISKTKLRKDHPYTLLSMATLASIYESQGRWEETEKLEVQAIEISTTKLGEDHPDTLTSMGNLAATIYNQGRLDEAEKLGMQVMERRKIKLGEDHPDTLTSMHDLAFIWYSMGKLSEAIVLMHLCIHLRNIKLGAGHPHTQSSVSTLKDWESLRSLKN